MKRFGLWMRTHWKLVTAVSLAIVAAIATGLLVAFFPPALAFVAGFSVFGFTPFAAIAGWSVVAAAFASAGIAAAAVALLTGFANLMITITNALNTAIVPVTLEKGGSEDDLGSPRSSQDDLYNINKNQGVEPELKSKSESESESESESTNKMNNAFGRSKSESAINNAPVQKNKDEHYSSPLSLGSKQQVAVNDVPDVNVTNVTAGL